MNLSPDSFKKQPKNASNFTVVYIEDNPVNQELMQAIADMDGHTHLIIAENAEEGLTSIENHQPDLILMDINLPGMNGYQALSSLQQSANAQIPVVAITANAMQTDQNKGLAAGFSDYITKPLQLTDLLTLLTHYRTLSQQGRYASKPS